MDAQRGFSHFSGGGAMFAYQTDSGGFDQSEGESVKAGNKGKNKWFGHHRCPFSRPFLCTQQLSLPLPRHHQSQAVTHLHLAVWLSCLSGACSDKWNWTGLAGGPRHERGPSWETSRSDPAAFSKGHPGCRASQPREEWVSPTPALSVPVPT